MEWHGSVRLRQRPNRTDEHALALLRQKASGIVWLKSIQHTTKLRGTFKVRTKALRGQPQLPRGGDNYHEGIAFLTSLRSSRTSRRENGCCLFVTMRGGGLQNHTMQLWGTCGGLLVQRARESVCLRTNPETRRGGTWPTSPFPPQHSQLAAPRTPWGIHPCRFRQLR